MRGLALITVAAVALPAAAAPAPAPLPPLAPLAAPIERRLHSDLIDASSFLWNDWNKFVENYHPNYVADDDPATAWVEGAKGSGAGEWLRIQLTPLDRTTRIRLRIRNGYQKSKELFAANARARQVTLRLQPSKVAAKITLADKDGWQDAVIDQPSGPVRAVELVVDSVYEGKKYEDLCISDIQVFATSLTPDNPAFEKSKHKTLMDWRAARLAAAAQFKSQKVALPVYPAYEVTATDARVEGDSDAMDALIEAARKDAAFADWRDALAVASAAAGALDTLPRAQIAPTSQDRLVASDGLQLVRMQDLATEYDPEYDAAALRLPMLGYVSTMFTDQLRVLDVKDTRKVSDFLAEDGRCKADVAWVKRSQPKDGPARVQAIVLGRCAKLEAREGTYNARAIELYVYDAGGQLVLSVGRGHLDAYRWARDGGRPMLAGGRALLSPQGKRIEARKRDAVAAR